MVVTAGGTFEVLPLLQPSDRPIEARTHLTLSPAAPAEARRFIRDALRRTHFEPVTDIVTLLASELVTNAVLHAASHVDLAVCADGDVVRVEVADTSSRMPEPARYEPDAQTGRGLGVVAAEAHDWGTRVTAGGKIVWFEVSR